MKKRTLDDERLMTASEVAEILGVNARTVLRWAGDKLLPSIRIGSRTIRFIRSEIEDWLVETAETQR